MPNHIHFTPAVVETPGGAQLVFSGSSVHDYSFTRERSALQQLLQRFGIAVQVGTAACIIECLNLDANKLFKS